MGILDLYARLGDRGASESLETAKYKEKEKEIRENPQEIDPDSPKNKMDDYFDPKQSFLAGAKGAAQGAQAGASVGAKVDPTGTAALAGGVIGGTVGFIAGAMQYDMGQQKTFTQALDAYNIKKDLKKEQEKMATAAGRESLRAAKRAKEKSARAPDLQAITSTDSDIMGMMQAGGVSQYDAGMNRTFGYGVA
jgi:hypothetical protein